MGLLFIDHPSLRSDIHPTENIELDLEKITSGSHIKIAWQCNTCNYSWLAKAKDRARGRGCPQCAKVSQGAARALAPINKSLAAIFPEVAAEWHPTKNGTRTPETTYPKSGASVWWYRESCGHSWEAPVEKRTTRGYGCSVCSNYYIVIGVNDIPTRYPHLAEEWDVEKNGEYAGKLTTTTRYWWRCSSGHSWEASLDSRMYSNTGCKECYLSPTPGINDLVSTYPDIASEFADDLNSMSLADLSMSSGQGVWWRCASGHEWKVRVSHRTYKETKCPTCSAGASTSRAEKDLLLFIQQTLPNEDILTQYKPFEDRRSFDIYIPKKKIAIEFNGIYWHSEKFRDKDYHLKKHQDAAKLGIQIITIWEDDWNIRRTVVENTLRHKLNAASDRADARKLALGECTPAEGRVFLENTHIQGATGLSRRFVLRDSSNTIVALLGVKYPSAAHRQHRSEGEYEIARYASSKVVRGGFSRLLRYAERTLLAESRLLTSWVSFAARDVSGGSMYEQSGFTIDNYLPADYKYTGAITKHTRWPKERFQKARFRDNPDLKYKEGLTERELAELNGLVRVWDCGKIRYTKPIIR